MSFQEINVKPKAETIKKLTKYIYQGVQEMFSNSAKTGPNQG